MACPVIGNACPIPIIAPYEPFTRQCPPPLEGVEARSQSKSTRPTLVMHEPEEATLNRTRKNIIVGVMGSGSESHEKLAVPLGVWLAENGYSLLTGGGPGVMTAVTKAFVSVENRTGIALGVIPADPEHVDSGKSKVHYPNPWVEFPIRTHLPGVGGPTSGDSRNHINVLTSDLIVALPGRFGTLAEIKLAKHYRKPIILFFDPEVEKPWPEEPPEVPVTHDLEVVKAFLSVG